MKKYKLVLFVMSSFLISGCGPNVAGNYVGTSTLSMTGQAASSGQSSIIISNPSGSTVSGTVTGAGLSGNFTGSAVQSGLISNVTLTTVATGVQSAYPTTGYPTAGYPGYPTNGYPTTGYPTAGYPMTGYPSYCGSTTFTGNLTVSNNQLSGTLTSIAQPSVNGMVNTMCSGTLTISGVKAN